ncbi:MAG TPA: glycosyl hydrolase, partial [Candidatus Saccharimonadales bacterium]
LNDAFSKRLGAKYFYYDSQLKGVAPYEAAFGAEDFNDHHFHYGYYLYAASILAANDQAFLAKHRDQLDVLAADIATPKKTASLPEYRHYDPYAGHSWAAGLAPFADGNNQESSSEAMHAWNAVSLWGKVTANKSLQQTGEILLANEAYTARTLWRDVTVSGYDQPLVVLNWGGKRDYATFFSDRPSVMLGIQLIPLDPSMVASLRDDKSLVNRLVSASITGQDFNVPLGDYGMMYLAFSDAERAYQLALTQQDDSIDDGNSRTYLYAWIMNLR